jgi:hypothetical protein
MSLQIQASDRKVTVTSPIYCWEWDRDTDILFLYDSERRVIGHGHHQPFLLTTLNQNGVPFQNKTFKTGPGNISITYRGDRESDQQLTVSWHFKEDHILLDPVHYRSPLAEDILQVVYFPEAAGETYRPSFYSRYAVVPGLSMSPNISPVIDLHSRLSTTAVLGAGAMRGPGFTQQWGLPAHYFCTFNTAERWNAIGAKERQSGAACWGLAELPAGDFRLEIREIGLSPILNMRSDLWGQFKTPGDLQLGPQFLITFGPQFHEAIRNYYKILIREKTVQPKQNLESTKKSTVLCAPQYNTWGVEAANAMPPEELNETIVMDIFRRLQASGMRARTFVIDDKWEGRYGELRHDQARFPNFISMLKTIRESGYFIGLWAAFLRCQDPAALGLDESHLLQKHGGGPLWLTHQTARYGIFDVTQLVVQDVLKERARKFIRDYQPDLIKFDFGYELPSLDLAAPADLRWSGERLLQKGLDVIVGAMKEENPDLVIMYYGLSPLLIDYYDLHSPDDLVYCGGDYDLETNRRIFFSSLCGELGMPTYGSSGYDWLSAPEIWFDSVPSGTLGSLHCFEGDENGDLPRPEWIAKYNGLSAILRKKSYFSTQPVDAKWQGGLRSAFSPSWERIENDRTVLLALRTHRFDGQPASPCYKAVLDRNVMLVVASMTEDEIACAERLGIVLFGNGSCTIQHTAPHSTATVIEHYSNGSHAKTQIVCHNQQIQLNLRQTHNDEIVEWLEIIFKE